MTHPALRGAVLAVQEAARDLKEAAEAFEHHQASSTGALPWLAFEKLGEAVTEWKRCVEHHQAMSMEWGGKT